MAVTYSNYGMFEQSLLEGRVNLQVDEIWCMLVTSGYSFSPHAHKFKSVISNELSGSGYVPGGKQVPYSAPTYDAGSKSTTVHASVSAWPVVTFTGATGAVLYLKPAGITTETAWPLIGYVGFGESINRASQAFYVNWPSTGIIKLTSP